MTKYNIPEALSLESSKTRILNFVANRSIIIIIILSEINTRSTQVRANRGKLD